MLNALFYNPPLEGNRIDAIVKEIYIDAIYEPYLQGKKDLTVVDCGANIGLFSQYIAPLAKQIYSIEPSTTHFAALSSMIAYNKLTNIKPCNYAVSNTDGEMEFYHYPNQTMNSLSQIQGMPLVQKERVKTIRLDTFFKQEKIEHVDVMKVDIEGEEFKVLGGDGFGNIADKVDVVIGEVHNWGDRNPNQLRSALEERGFTVTTIPNEATIFVGVR